VTHDPDVLIVGAGPAGSIAALVLARAGLTVRIVDRSRFPREKLCGDTLNPGSLALLDRLGISAGVRKRALAVTGMVVTGPGGTRVVGEYESGLRGAAISRHDLDLLLLEEATQAGAAFDAGVMVRGPLLSADGSHLVGVRVAANAEEHDLRARLVIAADGRHSRLAFNLGLSAYAVHPRRWAFGAYYTDVDGLTACGEMHIRVDGYIGVAPLPDGVTNVCVVRQLPSPFRAQRLEAETVIESAIAAEPLLRERFARARRVTGVTSLGPLAVESRGVGIRGLLLAGDAAGFIDPMTGDGLRFAIRGAELAADFAMRELETGRASHPGLLAARRREFRSKWRIDRALRAMVAWPYGVRLTSAVASRWDRPIKTLIAVAGDVGLARRGLGARDSRPGS
jgi:geranylgeranyl reductase family protein